MLQRCTTKDCWRRLLFSKSESIVVASHHKPHPFHTWVQCHEAPTKEAGLVTLPLSSTPLCQIRWILPASAVFTLVVYGEIFLPQKFRQERAKGNTECPLTIKSKKSIKVAVRDHQSPGKSNSQPLTRHGKVLLSQWVSKKGEEQAPFCLCCGFSLPSFLGLPLSQFGTEEPRNIHSTLETNRS